MGHRELVVHPKATSSRETANEALTPAEIARALAGFDSGLLSDAVERVLGARALVGIRALSPRPRRFAGRALTVGLGPSGPGESTVHLGARAIDASRPGDVIVVANGGRLDAASWGGLLSTAAAMRGVVAVVIDGVCRDVDDLWDLDLEVFCRGVVPLTARGRVIERSFNEPVSIAGLRVTPGDWVTGDASGVVLVPPDHVGAVLSAARLLALREDELRAAIAAGESVSEILDRRYESLLEHDG